MSQSDRQIDGQLEDKSALKAKYECGMLCLYASDMYLGRVLRCVVIPSGQQ